MDVHLVPVREMATVAIYRIYNTYTYAGVEGPFLECPLVYPIGRPAPSYMYHCNLMNQAQLFLYLQCCLQLMLCLKFI